MFTSRAEFRLHLRIDNADRRLTPHGRRVGLITDAAWADFQAKQQRLEAMKQLLERTKLTSTMLEKRIRSTWGQPPSSVQRSEAPRVATTSISPPSASRWPNSSSAPKSPSNNSVPVLRELAPEFLRSSKIPRTPRNLWLRFLPRPQRTQIRRNRNQVRRLPPPAAARHRPPEKGRAAPHPRMVRLPLGQRPLPRNAGKTAQDPPPHPGPGLAHPGRDSRRRFAGQRLHRNPGQTPRAGGQSVVLKETELFGM